MADLILEAVNLSFTYPDGTKALNSINLAIERGKKVAVLGPNGAGKSTLFLHFNGVLKPASGKVRFAGNDISYQHSALMELRQNVGIVFQDPDSQLFSASVRQEISFGPLNLGLDKVEVLRRVEAAMEATEICHLQHKPTHLLSYGQKKRVSIADILAMEPEVLIFDEPTAWLDPRHSKEIIDLINRFNREGKTIILSTHDVDLAYSWSDYIYIIINGQVAGMGEPQEIFQDGALLEHADLTKPWVLEVYEEMKQKGWIPLNSPAPRTKEELFSLMQSKEYGEKKIKRAI
ncbi:energy-coupling factor ABC transporter ATP-binding protein [Zhaonella formicivorans]|uniref:energy-coupling factor ABC transporter ATP-binding protein n=1 Tax=Zhaonella formicivorans TaxID=2528593 RepID=UPI0010CE6643|nr:ATP-binding cassette domain-containing protein [Zhaonella formicivorans]